MTNPVEHPRADCEGCNKPDCPCHANVYEVYGKTALSQGWDCIACTSLKEALAIIEGDMDELDPNPDAEDEIRIVFRRYTKSQMEDIIYE